MKAVILAGGLGTRISEETVIKPKPMVEIGGKPIIWHIMKMYSNHGINDFIICAGYKGYVIKEYFANYFLHKSNVTFNFKENDLVIHDHDCEPWTVTVIETGEHTMTGGRLKRIAPYVQGESFCATYGDGVSDVDITKLIKFHKDNGKLATLTSIVPIGRFGALEFNGNQITKFIEKPPGDGLRVNGGFFVIEPEALDLIDGDEVIWEKEPLEMLASQGQLNGYMHNGFWQPMDTLRDKLMLDKLCAEGCPPWLMPRKIKAPTNLDLSKIKL